MNFEKVNVSKDALVHDISFDYYGHRFATCSSDRTIKVWNYQAESSKSGEGHWTSEVVLKHQHDIVWRLHWANPEFGQLLASCSEDGKLVLCEEQDQILPTETSTSTGLNINATNVNTTNNLIANYYRPQWVQKFKYELKNVAIRDVKFSHRNAGLTMGAVSSDGYLRIFRAPNVLNVKDFELQLEFEVEDTSPFNPSASNNKSSNQKSISSSSKSATPISEHGLTCLSWNDCPFEWNMLVVGGHSKRAVVYSFTREPVIKKCVEECVLGEHLNAVHDVAWAPVMGRSFHLIATASREPVFRIHKLKRLENGSVQYVSTETIESSNKSNVWRVVWNATGTVLATSCEDGLLSLWRKNFSGTWINVQTLPIGGEELYHFYQTT